LDSLQDFLFWFPGQKDNFPRADIDIGIVGPEAIPAKIKLEIEEKIDNLPTLYKFDIIDFKKCLREFQERGIKRCRVC